MSGTDRNARGRPSRRRRWGWLATAATVGLAISITAFVPSGAARVGSLQKPSAKYKVALLEVGTPNDGSWGQSWAQGVKTAAKKYGVQVSIAPNLNTPDQYVSAGASYAGKGYNLILIADGAVADATAKLARRFPKVQFVQCAYQFRHPADAKKEPANVGHCDIEQQQSAFFAGVLSGMITKTNKIASVNGYAFPAFTRQPEAFSLGARCVNAHVQFQQKYINSFSDTALAKSATDAYIADGADIIFDGVDEASPGVYASAQAAPHQTFVIGAYFDNHTQAPSVILTSVLYNLPGLAVDLIKRGKSGKIGPHFFHDYNYKNFPGAAALAPFFGLGKYVPASARKQLALIQRQFKAGKITIPDETIGAHTIGAPGSADKINVRSLGCKPVR